MTNAKYEHLIRFQKYYSKPLDLKRLDKDLEKDTRQQFKDMRWMVCNISEQPLFSNTAKERFEVKTKRDIERFSRIVETFFQKRRPDNIEECKRLISRVPDTNNFCHNIPDVMWISSVMNPPITVTKTELRRQLRIDGRSDFQFVVDLYARIRETGYILELAKRVQISERETLILPGLLREKGISGIGLIRDPRYRRVMNESSSLHDELEFSSYPLYLLLLEKYSRTRLIR